MMIDFKDILENPEKYAPKPITGLDQEINVGDKVRCYSEDTNDMHKFMDYGTVHEVLGKNYCWCSIPDGFVEAYVIKIP